MNKTDKILLENIYYMIAYSFHNLSMLEKSVMTHEPFEHLDQLIAELLIVGMNKQIKSGLAKDYIDETESLKTLRGKINLNESIKKMSLIKKELVCEYDEYSENILINQIIKTVMICLLSSQKVNKNRKKFLKRNLLFLTNVDVVNLKSLNFNRIQVKRHHQSYKPMLFACFMFQQQAIMKESESGFDLNNFADSQPMHALYENFVLNYFRVHYPELLPKGMVLRWESEDKNNILPIMATDINLYGTNKTLIIDTKYYNTMYATNYDKKSIHSNNLYQMYAYVSNYHRQYGQETIGMLLYAQTSHQEPLYEHLNVNGFHMYFRSLNLDQPFKEISRSLNEIAELA